MARGISLFLWLFSYSFSTWTFSNAEPLYAALGARMLALSPDRQHYVALISTIVGGRLCTGSLISKNHVLTAAKCLKDVQSWSHVRVIFGSADPLSPAHKKFEVMTEHSYKKWCEGKVGCFLDERTDDITILELKVQDTGIEPADIGDFNNDPDTKVKLVGWGLTNRDTNLRSPWYAFLTILSKQSCEHQVRQQIPSCLSDVVLPAEKVFCAVSKPTILGVEGDFGGPVSVHHRRKISGILVQRCPTYGPNDFGGNQVNLILRLDPYTTYIADTVFGH